MKHSFEAQAYKNDRNQLAKTGEIIDLVEIEKLPPGMVIDRVGNTWKPVKVKVIVIVKETQ